jgi:hypothetical protein
MFSPSELIELDELNKVVEYAGIDWITADESAFVKQAFKHMHPEQDEKLYERTVRNFPIEHDEAITEMEAAHNE